MRPPPLGSPGPRQERTGGTPHIPASLWCVRDALGAHEKHRVLRTHEVVGPDLVGARGLDLRGVEALPSRAREQLGGAGQRLERDGRDAHPHARVGRTGGREHLGERSGRATHEDGVGHGQARKCLGRLARDHVQVRQAKAVGVLAHEFYGLGLAFDGPDVAGAREQRALNGDRAGAGTHVPHGVAARHAQLRDGGRTHLLLGHGYPGAHKELVGDARRGPGPSGLHGARTGARGLHEHDREGVERLSREL